MSLCKKASRGLLLGQKSQRYEMSKARDIADSAATINVLDGVSTTPTELNVLSGIPAGLTSTELGYVDGDHAWR